MRKPGATPADRCNAVRTSMPTATPIPAAGPIDATADRGPIRLRPADPKARPPGDVDRSIHRAHDDPD